MPVDSLNSARALPPRATKRWYIQIGLILLVLIAIATRFPAPWRMEVTNDEMLHLKSWRNHYGTNSIFPLFVARLQSLPKSRLNQQLIDLYNRGPLFQRGFLILTDGHPPTFPSLMEAIQTFSNSSLIAQRTVSAVMSLASIVTAFFIGRKIKDDALGLCLSTLFCVSATGQIFAGIARPYATGELTLLLAILAFAKDTIEKPSSPRLLLIFALIAQSLQWFNWIPVGILVAAALIRRCRGGATVGQLLRQTWGYALASLLLLAYAYGQTKNPTLANRFGGRSFLAFWIDFTAASPLSELGRFGSPGFSIGAAIFVLLILGGALALFIRGRENLNYRAVAGPFLIVLAVCAIMMPICPVGPRFLIPFMVMPILLAGICLREAAQSAEATGAAAISVLLILGGLSLVFPADPYDRFVPTDQRYSALATELAGRLQPGDIWIAYPYFLGDRLYRYAAIPAPIQPQSPQEMTRALEHAEQDAGHSCYVVIEEETAKAFRDLRDAPVIWKTSPVIELRQLPHQQPGEEKPLHGS